MVNQFQAAFKVDMGPEIEMLMSVTDQLDKILFDDYIKRKSMEVAKIITKGVLGGAINWYEAPKPTGEFSFMCNPWHQGQQLIILVLQRSILSSMMRYCRLYWSMPRCLRRRDL